MLGKNPAIVSHPLYVNATAGALVGAYHPSARILRCLLALYESPQNDLATNLTAIVCADADAAIDLAERLQQARATGRRRRVWQYHDLVVCLAQGSTAPGAHAEAFESAVERRLMLVFGELAVDRGATAGSRSE